MNYFFLGIGQAGNNIADKAAEIGFKAFGINSSERDLEPLTHLNDKLIVGTTSGCAKDRNIGKTIFETEKEKIRSFLEKGYNENQHCFLVFSLGGGTGSSIGPLIAKELKERNKSFTAVVIHAYNQESGRAFYNEFNALKEIYSLSIPIISLDNNKIIEHSPNATKGKYDSFNYSFVKRTKAFLEKIEGSKNGNMDEMEKRKLLSVPGLLKITVSKPYNTEALSTETNENIKTFDIYTEVEIAPTFAGHIFHYKEKAPTPNFELIYKDLVMPPTRYDGFVPSKEDKSISILAGLPFPVKRIHELQTKQANTQAALNLINSKKQEVEKLFSTTEQEIDFEATPKSSSNSNDLFGDTERNIWGD